MYVNIAKHHCFDDQYGSYKSLEDAIFVCNQDDRCGKVYDQGCKGHLQDKFALCPHGSKELTSTVSCLYAKPGNYAGNMNVIPFLLPTS